MVALSGGAAVIDLQQRIPVSADPDPQAIPTQKDTDAPSESGAGS